MSYDQGWRGIILATASAVAATGCALRRAFPIRQADRALDVFEASLARLDRRHR